MNRKTALRAIKQKPQNTLINLAKVLRKIIYLNTNVREKTKDINVKSPKNKTPKNPIIHTK